MVGEEPLELPAFGGAILPQVGEDPHRQGVQGSEAVEADVDAQLAHDLKVDAVHRNPVEKSSPLA
jgi:hypothetical protein